MISFEDFILADDAPIYLQIIRYIKRGIVAEHIQDQDEMPSRRVLSALLGVNPNTIQKAYHMLEEEGIIVSKAGAKSFVTVREDMVEDIRKELLQKETKEWIGAMKQMQVSKEEALEVVRQMWEQ